MENAKDKVYLLTLSYYNQDADYVNTDIGVFSTIDRAVGKASRLAKESFADMTFELVDQDAYGKNSAEKFLVEVDEDL